MTRLLTLRSLMQAASILFAVCMATAAFGVTVGENVVLRVRDGKRISYDLLAQELKGTDFVFVGENHDNPAHHAAQIRIIAELQNRQAPLALGLEMFPAIAQPELDAWLIDKLPDTVFRALYRQTWNMPWELYGPIFDLARDRQIPLVGINIPRGIVKKVFRGGVASLAPEERQEMPDDVSCRIDPEYRELIRNTFKSHAGRGGKFERFCEAQMLWTKGMAMHLTRYLELHPGRLVVVLTGAGHALRMGIPEQIDQDGRYSSRIVLPELKDLDRKSVTLNEADYLILDPFIAGY